MLALITVNTNAPYGPAQCSVDILVALLANGQGIGVVSPDRNDRDPRLGAAEREGRLDWTAPPPEAGLRMEWGRQTPWYVKEWFRRRRARQAGRRRIRDWETNGVIVNGLGAVTMWEAVRGLFSGPRMLVVHESPGHFGPERPRGLDAARAAFRPFDRCLFVSEEARREWQAGGFLEGKTSTYLPNCCREEEVARVRTRDPADVRRGLGRGEDERLIVCVASVQHRKGQDVLLEAAGPVLAADERIRMVLVGPVIEDWGKAFSRRVQDGPWADRIELVGARTDALEWLRAAEVLVLPSRAEAMPLVVLEAMAMETPVAATKVYGVAELIRDGVDGRTCPPDDPKALADGLLDLLRDPARARRMARMARSRYASEFARSQQIRRWGDVLREVGVASS
jgi:glycosyltransferase involved in cell wall biosynthesis